MIFDSWRGWTRAAESIGKILPQQQATLGSSRRRRQTCPPKRGETASLSTTPFYPFAISTTRFLREITRSHETVLDGLHDHLACCKSIEAQHLQAIWSIEIGFFRDVEVVGSNSIAPTDKFEH
jgi:hypothetical protein